MVLVGGLDRCGWRDYYLAEDGLSVLGVKGFEFCALIFPVGRKLEALLPEMTEPTRTRTGIGADVLGFDHVVCRVQLKRRDSF